MATVNEPLAQYREHGALLDETPAEKMARLRREERNRDSIVWKENFQGFRKEVREFLLKIW